MNSNIILPGLKDVMVTNMEEVEEKLILNVELPIKTHSCPHCHSITKSTIIEYKNQ